MAAGLAFGGLHPVVAIYATFLNRAFDQMLMDCALHKAGVTFVLDRSGVTGPDGASHHGMWDMSLASVVPGLHLAAPRDGEHVATALRESIDISDAPSIIRFPKGSSPAPIPAVRSAGGVDVLVETSDEPVDELIIGIGSMVPTALTVTEKLAAEGRSVRAVDPVWALPVSSAVVHLARSAGRVTVIEDNLVSSGVGTQISLALADAGVSVPVRLFGIPKRFLDHASRGQVLEEIGLTAEAIASALLEG